MMKQWIALSLAYGMIGNAPAIAQQVPAIQSTVNQATVVSPYAPYGFQPGSYQPAPAPPQEAGQPMTSANPAMPPVMTPYQPRITQPVQLNKKEQAAITLANQWINRPEIPLLNRDGCVTYRFGASLPSVICAPFHTCTVSLQPGERVIQTDIGDKDRWNVSPALSGSGENKVTHLIVKPLEANLKSNLTVNTNRRTYVIRLISKEDTWMPQVAFTYPDDAEKQWADYYKATTDEDSNEATSYNLISNGNINAFHPNQMDYGYRLRGDSPSWKPIRVYTDHAKTFIQFPLSVETGEAPALVVLGNDNQEQIVNYRKQADLYVVDKVIQKALLLNGIGRHQEKVEIDRASR